MEKLPANNRYTVKFLAKRLSKMILAGFLFGSFLFVLFPPAFAWALESVGLDVANSYQLTDKDTVDGDILSTSNNGLVRSKTSYDPDIFGVLTLNPLVVFKVQGSDDLPVSRNGTVIVNVTTFNGVIAKGDLITSSEIVGKGMRASTSGYVLGTAMESFDGKEGSKISFGGQEYSLGRVQVALRVEYAEVNSPQSFKRLFDYVGVAFFSSVKDPNRFGQLIRYIAAGLIVLSCVVFAFVTFSKSIPKGIEAIGRNPLAKSSIMVSIVLSIIFMVLIIAAGIVAAVVVLRI